MHVTTHAEPLLYTNRLCAYAACTVSRSPPRLPQTTMLSALCVCVCVCPQLATRNCCDQTNRGRRDAKLRHMSRDDSKQRHHVKIAHFNQLYEMVRSGWCPLRKAGKVAHTIAQNRRTRCSQFAVWAVDYIIGQRTSPSSTIVKAPFVVQHRTWL